jgi:hypothetical protein
MSKVLTGSRASVKIQGVKVAFAGSWNVTQENTLTDIDVLDQLQVAELAETGHKVNCSMNLFKVDANASVAIGLETTNIDDLLNQAELTIELYDRLEDKVQYLITGAKFEGGSGSIDARGVWNGVWNFRGRLGGATAGQGSL